MAMPNSKNTFKQKLTLALIAVLTFLIILIAFNYFKTPTSIVKPLSQATESAEIREKIRLGSAEFNLEIADTDTERQKGLSGRKTLGENEGLLFVFTETHYPNFWMKEMNFALDIIWLDENLKVVGITENIAPETFPETFTSPEPVKYVLEINAGISRQKNIKVGDMIESIPPQYKPE